MFNPANTAHFSLSIHGSTSEGEMPDFQVLSFTGQESISQPFRFDLELVS
ncbi:hypothetical protein, partial [Pseudomonas sp. UBA7233]